MNIQQADDDWFLPGFPAVFNKLIALLLHFKIAHAIEFHFAYCLFLAKVCLFVDDFARLPGFIIVSCGCLNVAAVTCVNLLETIALLHIIASQSFRTATDNMKHER